MTKTAKKLAPREARTLKEICSLKRDNLGFERFWFLLDGPYVVIAEQTGGEPAKAIIKMPRRVFDRIVDWYNGDA